MHHPLRRPTLAALSVAYAGVLALTTASTAVAAPRPGRAIRSRYRSQPCRQSMGLLRRTPTGLWSEGTLIGVTSKPIQVDALKNFDAERYADWTWNVDDVEREPILADPHNPAAFNPFMVVPGAEEGLAWGILTQPGTLLDAKEGRAVLGGQKAKTVLFMGQSQSGV
jgi:hypothetical protein